MALRELDYQRRVLTRLDDYLTELVKQKANADQIAELARQNPNLRLPIPDFARDTWEALRAADTLPASRAETPFSPRQDGAERSVPNVVFKVPTGGGKTFLAVESLAKIFGRYLGRQTGFVLWIVPNEAIYTQTRKHLTDRQHPYRQMLEVLAGQRVRILEKDDPLDAREVESHLCVMLLMLQAGNRENKDSLRMFRDRGDVRGFLEPYDDQLAHAKALAETPNLDVYDLADSAYSWPQVKESLGNALRLIRPVVVMDEGHKAVSELAFKTLYGFNPCFVLELTATPKDVLPITGKNPKPGRYANVLVQVQGIDLDREGMIKMPLNLDPRRGDDWRHTLAAALERLRRLDEAARRFQADSGRYIRPILLVQVERTGGEQRDGAHVHALDAKDWLMTVGGLDTAEIAIKTAETNDLAAPENQDLLAPTNRVRVIVTKQALQEGWDCPFAYVLCVLAASSNLSALTQLIGRILRQPHAQKTGVALLDESYVLTHHGDTAQVVEAIKRGLEEDGMGDLVGEIRSPDPSHAKGPRAVYRRDNFAKTAIYLPKVLRVADGVVRELDYEEDILFPLEWLGLDVSPLIERLPDNYRAAEQQLRRFRLADDGKERVVVEPAGASTETRRFDVVHAVRLISDIVPNAWWARAIVGDVLAGLKARGFDAARLGELSGLIVEEMRAWLDGVRDAKAEALFQAEVAAGRIQFRLRTDRHNWKMPNEAVTYEPVGADQLVGGDGQALRKSLFSPIYRGDFSSQDERDIAVYLDGVAAVGWWHRNVARSHYAIQGWRCEKIYPDFLFAVHRDDTGEKRVALEVKGKHLAGNEDTEYKRAVLRLVTEAFLNEPVARVGELDLVRADGTTVVCDLVLMPEWRARLPDLLT
jgi:type III restriction enzyme